MKIIKWHGRFAILDCYKIIYKMDYDYMLFYDTKPLKIHSLINGIGIINIYVLFGELYINHESISDSLGIYCSSYENLINEYNKMESKCCIS